MPNNTPPRNAISTPFLQSTPFCLKSSSIPIDAKTFKAEDIGDDLIIKLENATISESPDTKSNPALRLEYVQFLLDSSVVLQKVSFQLSSLKDHAGELFYNISKLVISFQPSRCPRPYQTFRTPDSRVPDDPDYPDFPASVRMTEYLHHQHFG